jgi:hypothetical protein
MKLLKKYSTFASATLGAIVGVGLLAIQGDLDGAPIIPLTILCVIVAVFVGAYYHIWGEDIVRNRRLVAKSVAHGVSDLAGRLMKRKSDSGE